MVILNVNYSSQATGWESNELASQLLESTDINILISALQVYMRAEPILINEDNINQ